MTDEELIAKHIREMSFKSGGARVIETGVPVWIIATCDHAWNNDTKRIELEYQPSDEAIEAARAYYCRHKREVDACGFAASGRFPGDI